ncbi:ImmA/IrrE family metallo-endopeptidase [Chryseobacterium arthrosphaerae]|uniref:ImmA/IrrE family metallo-endopeptidase n=1 Tax=Chryseobacterium arthrosphaerae TaxID=651561 RepID=UPI0024153B8A|nr:ImmA/IrrE family metallo-endopeptidase [Chryseobacterium arthrosphaerae]MDG4655032.1 ImmA/IrrE family metallo-endopeptidase [Chryseobacterium arthrosphaerae]
MINYDIERIVNSIIEKSKISKAPVDIETICLNYDISLEPIDAEDNLSGFFLINESKKKIIGYNKKHPDNRVRFTIAHEFGHFQLHCKKDHKIFIDSKFFRNELSSSGTLRQEREANAFAAALLMPIALLEKELSKIKQDKRIDEILPKLSRSFKVSEESMKFRLINLGMLDPN